MLVVKLNLVRVRVWVRVVCGGGGEGRKYSADGSSGGYGFGKCNARCETRCEIGG